MRFFAWCPDCGTGLNFNNVVNQIGISGGDEIVIYLICDDCEQQCKTTVDKNVWTSYCRDFVKLQKEITSQVGSFSFDMEDTDTVEQFMRYAGAFSYVPHETEQRCKCPQCSKKVTDLVTA